MLRLCITNVRTFQHGHPVYLGALQKMSSLNDKSCLFESYFLDFEDDKTRNKRSDFYLTSINLVELGIVKPRSQTNA